MALWLKKAAQSSQSASDGSRSSNVRTAYNTNTQSLV